MKQFICIVCPNSCLLNVEEVEGQIVVSGNKCKKGETYALDELKNPKRALTTTVATTYKNKPRLPVKTRSEIPKQMLQQAILEAAQILIDKPVKRGDVIIENICHCGVDLIATSDLLLW